MTDTTQAFCDRLNRIFSEHGTSNRVCEVQQLLAGDLPGVDVTEIARGAEYSQYVATGSSGMTVGRAAVLYTVREPTGATAIVSATIAFNQGRDAAFECKALPVYNDQLAASLFKGDRKQAQLAIP